jgi:hypothetical protein
MYKGFMECDICGAESLCDSRPDIWERKHWDMHNSKEHNSLSFHVVQHISDAE